MSEADADSDRRSVSRKVERKVRRLLKQSTLSLREIGRKAGCSHNTVARIRDGKQVKRKKPEGKINVYKACERRLCPACSEVAGRDIYVHLDPCPACDARAGKRA